MAAPASAEEFLDLVRKSGVVDEKRLDTYATQLRGGGGFPDEPGKMAGLMVRDGLLTHFQAEQVLLGKWRRFTIGKYKVLERLGSGGMGSVYLCEHKFMRRRVAVKVLPAAKAEDPASLERFYREARAAAALDHPNIVRAYDIDQDENLHFLVMEYVDGASLQEIIKKAGPMSVLRACHYMRQAAIGMQHAHEAGLVHRDIKPGNVLVDRSGTVKVLDMGLARFFHDEEDILTKKYDESVLGTADYLAPEQALDSHGVDIRADIYSLGATMYFCLTGQPPFNEGTVAQKLIWHQTRQPKPVRTLRPDVPEPVAAIIEKMMVKDRAKRYQTPAQVAESLAPLTTKPIPPPPDVEMPRLSPAAMGAAGGEMSTATMPATAPSSSAQRAAPVHTPAPRPAPSPVAAPPASRPPSGHGTPDPQRVVAAQQRPMPQPRPAPAAVPNNGNMTPAPAHRMEEHAPNWGDLATGSPAVPAGKTGVQAASARKASGVQTGVVSFLGRVRARPKFWGLLVGGAFIGFLMFVAIVWLVFSKKSTPNPTGASKRVVASVSKDADKGDFRTVKEALLKAEPGDTIVVKDETHEEILELQTLGRPVKDITIEADPSLISQGRRVVWRPPPDVKGITAPPNLLSLTECPGLTLKGFHFTGQNTNTQIPTTLAIHGRCPGLKVEDVTLAGFTASPIKLTSCSGEADRPVLFKNVTTLPPEKEALAAVILEVHRDYPSLLATDHVRLEDCCFEGPFKTGVSLSVDGGFDVAGLELIRNRFSKAAEGLSFAIRRATAVAPTLRMTAESNTFFESHTGLHLKGLPSPEKSRVTLKNNLFAHVGMVASFEVEMQPGLNPGPKEAPVQWIWYDEGNPADAAPAGNVYFRKSFVLPRGTDVKNALLEVACDDEAVVWLNGKTKLDGIRLADKRIMAFDVTAQLRTSTTEDSTNWIAVQGRNDLGPAGLLLQLTALLDGNPERQTLATTDNTWQTHRGEPAPANWNQPDFVENPPWKAAKVICQYGKGMATNLTWQSVLEEQLRNRAEKICPADDSNVRDPASRVGNLPLGAKPVDCSSLNLNLESPQFLRYPKDSILNTSGANGGPVGVPPQ